MEWTLPLWFKYNIPEHPSLTLNGCNIFLLHHKQNKMVYLPPNILKAFSYVMVIPEHPSLTLNGCKIFLLNHKQINTVYLPPNILKAFSYVMVSDPRVL